MLESNGFYMLGESRLLDRAQAGFDTGFILGVKSDDTACTKVSVHRNALTNGIEFEVGTRWESLVFRHCGMLSID